MDIDDGAFSIKAGKNDSANYHEIKLKRYFDDLENEHYRIVFRIRRRIDVSQFIFHKPYEDILCMEEFDVGITN